MNKRTNSEKEEAGLNREQRTDPDGYTLRLSQFCPRCKAKPGERCKTKNGLVTRWHVARLVLAIKAREAQVAERENEIKSRETTWT